MIVMPSPSSSPSRSPRFSAEQKQQVDLLITERLARERRRHDRELQALMAERDALRRQLDQHQQLQSQPQAQLTAQEITHSPAISWWRRLLSHISAWRTTAHESQR